MNRISIALITALLICSTAHSQTKSETKLYNTTLSKPDIKSFDKFLAKFPNSIYAKEITHKKDSVLFSSLPQNSPDAYINFIKSYPQSSFLEQANTILEKMNTSSIEPSQAKTILKQVLDLPNNYNQDYRIQAVKISNIEHIIAILPPLETNKQNYKIVVLKHRGDLDLQNISKWNIIQNKEEARYVQNDKLSTFTFPELSESIQTITIGEDKYVLFNYINKDNGSLIEFITNLYSLNDGTVYSAMFSGKQEKDENISFIEGACMDSSQGGTLATSQMDYLIKHLASLDFLKPISKEKVLIDEAIEWWNSKNSTAIQTLSFGVLSNDNPIVESFASAKDKEKGTQWDIAFYDIRATTVVVAYNKIKNQYSLVWCEPAPKNTKTDKFLNTIYFENDSTIVLYYYKGNTTSKKRINLLSKTIR